MFVNALSPQASAVRFGKMPALVVDDNGTITAFHKSLLQKNFREHFDVFIANDRTAAKDLIKHFAKDGNPFRLVLMDNDMPNINNPKEHKTSNESDEGLKLGRFISKLPVEQRPVVVMASAPTKHKENALRSEAKAHGIIDLIVKPLTRLSAKEQLFEIIKTYFGLSPK